jgi:hypothetical protein
MKPHQSSLSSIALLLGTLALFACWLMPGHYVPWVTFQNEAVAVLAGILFCVAALLTADNGPRWPRASLFVAALAVVPTLQFFFGQIAFRSDAILSCLYLLTLALTIGAGSTLARADRRKFLDSVLGPLLAAGIASTGMALAQWLNLGLSDLIEWMPPGARAIANIAQPNHLAALLALGLLGALWLYETGRIHGRTLWFVALWLALGMAFTRSRMVWLAAATVLVCWIWLGTRIKLRLSNRALLAWVITFGTIVVALGPLSGAIDTHVPESVADRLQGGGGRLRIWATLIDGLMQSPWVGYGWSQVSRAALEGSLHHFTGESMLRQSHSVPLDLLIWNGIPLGLLLIGLIAAWWVHQLFRCDNAERACVLGVVGVLSLYSLVEFPLESFYFLVPFGLLVGALEGWSPSRASPTPGPRAAFALGVTSVAAVGAAVAIEYLEVEQASRDGRMLAAGFVSSAKLPTAVLLDEPIEYIRFWRTPARAGMSADELDWMRKVAGRNPAPPSLLRYATAAGLNGQAPLATDTLIRLCNMHRGPRCDEGRQSWALPQQNFPVLQSIAYPSTPTPP